MLYCQKVADRWGRRVGGGELGEPSAGKTETRARAQLRDRRISPNSRRLRLTELKLSSLHLKYPLFPWNSQPGCSCSRVTRGSSEGWRDAKLTIITRKDGHNLAHLGRKCLQLPGALDQHFPEFPITALRERKCLGLHGVPGLHFPECPRTTSTAPPIGAEVPESTRSSWDLFPRMPRGSAVHGPACLVQKCLQSLGEPGPHFLQCPRATMTTASASWAEMWITTLST